MPVGTGEANGSPVPGYAAPAETIPAAGRVGLVLAAIVVEHGDPDAAAGWPEVLRADVLPGLAPGLAVPAVVAWTQLYGTVGFELFGQYENLVLDRDTYFDHVADAAAASVGLS